MFKNPQDYSVLVAENMFGDIVSDLCAGLVGGLGFAPSANLGDNYAVFEPTHGSAPKYAGQYKVNPIAMLLTAKLMLDWLKEIEMATRLEAAVARVIAEGRVQSYDMSGRRSDTDSPHHGGQAVARAEKTPHSTWPKPSRTTRVHKLNRF